MTKGNKCATSRAPQVASAAPVAALAVAVLLPLLQEFIHFPTLALLGTHIAVEKFQQTKVQYIHFCHQQRQQTGTYCKPGHFTQRKRTT